MNICMLSPTYLPHVGGTELAIQNVAASLTERGHRVTIITSTPRRMSPREERGVRVIRVNIANARGTQYVNSNIQCFHLVVKEHSTQPFDYLQSFHVSSFGMTSVILKKVLGLPLITSLMGADTYSPQPDMAPKNRWLTLPFFPWIMNSSDVVTAPSKDLASHARRQGCRSDIVIVPHGVNPDRFDPSVTRTNAHLIRERLGISKDGIMLLTVHRLDKRKDFATAILALRNVLRHKSNVKLIVVGVGPEHERFLEIARREGVESSIVFAGSVSDEELPSYYGAADLFLLSTFYEAFGLVLLEAMAAAKCVIASSVGGVPEVVRDGVTGFLFPVSNVEVLTSILLGILEDGDRRLKMGEAGRKCVLEHYTWTEISKQYVNAFINR